MCCDVHFRRCLQCIYKVISFLSTIKGSDTGFPPGSQKQNNLSFEEINRQGIGATSAKSPHPLQKQFGIGFCPGKIPQKRLNRLPNRQTGKVTANFLNPR